MILTAQISSELIPTAAHNPATVDRARVGLLAPDANNCRLQIDRVVGEIDSPDVCEIVDTVFKDLLRLLECLSLIESHLRQVDASEETFALFQIIHEEARVLVEFIRQDGLNCDSPVRFIAPENSVSPRATTQNAVSENEADPWDVFAIAV